MVELQFDYEKMCTAISTTIKVENSNKYQSLVTSSIQGSILTTKTAKFQELYKDSPNNIETQLDMYAFLLDDVCRKIERGIQRLESNETKAKEINSELGNLVRTAYAITMMIADKHIPLRGDTPIFVGYLQEKFGDENPTTKKIEQIIDGYMLKFKVKEFADAQGITSEVIANLEALLL